MSSHAVQETIHLYSGRRCARAMRGKFQMDPSSVKIQPSEINTRQGAIIELDHIQAASDFGGRTVTIREDQIKAQPQGGLRSDAFSFRAKCMQSQ